jgi:predicted TIM-barrel fold metal-dependent hydrolase
MINAWDSDGHVSESEVTFSDKYWDPKLKDRRPTIIETGPNGPLNWMIDTRSFPVRSGPFQQAGFPLSKNGTPAKITPGISPFDPVESAEMRSVKSRLEQLDREKTDVQVIYPTMFLSYPITYDRAIAVAMMRAYNSWIADLTSEAPHRLKWVTVIDPVDPRASVEEIQRTKKMGSVAVMLLLEAGCSWVPGLVERITDYSGFPGARAGEDFRRGYNGKHLPKEYIERGQIYFGFEVDEKLLPFVLQEFGDECWLYGSDIPHGDRLYGAVDVFHRERTLARRASASFWSTTLLASMASMLRTGLNNLCAAGLPVMVKTSA